MESIESAANGAEMYKAYLAKRASEKANPYLLLASLSLLLPFSPSSLLPPPFLPSFLPPYLPAYLST